MIDFDPERDPVEQLAEEVAERCRRGEHPSVNEYAADYPQWAGEIRELLPQVVWMEELKRCRYPSLAPMSALSDIQPEQLGDYRIVRELGRGGMGIVYEAEQQSLGRRVALKVLPRQALGDPKKVERFRREAHAAARLHHTNIVSVFGVGEHDGLPYYVMQLIEGRGLHEVMAEAREVGELTRVVTRGENPWRFIAQLGAQAADALQYAHEHGILHRDVKPANLLLDTQGTLWVADFGLAKLSGLDDMTSTGDLLGTWQYLAPEALQAGTDARGDIYGLGATLYELLTLKPPFNELNPATLLRHICEREPTRPRQLQRSIPRDLETIVLTAMAREPERRYRTAGLLAEDLQRFVNDQPILARRTSALGRAWRWCRRNRVVTTLTSLTILSVMLAAIFGWTGYVSTRAALARESQKRDEAEEATKRVEANLVMSLVAFEDVFNSIPQRELLPFGSPLGTSPAPPPDGRPSRFGRLTAESEEDATLLQSILDFYDRFAEQNATNPQLQMEAAKAYRRVGQLHQRLGQSARADAAQRRAINAFEQLAAAYPAVSDYRAELIETYASIDVGRLDEVRLREVEAEFLRAANLAEQLVRGEPTVVRYQTATARLQAQLGQIFLQSGRLAEAETWCQAAVSTRLRLVEEQPIRADVRIELARARQLLAQVLIRLDRTAAARETLVATAGDLVRAERLLHGPGAWSGRSWPPPDVLLSGQYEILAQQLTKIGETKLAKEASKQAKEHHGHSSGSREARFGPGREPRPPRE